MDFREVDFDSIFLDRDGDGFTDTIDLQIHLSPSCGKPEILSAILNLTYAIGFESMGINLPIVTESMRRSLSFGYHLYIGVEKELKVISKNNIPTCYYLKGYDDKNLADSIKEFTLSLIRKNGKKSKKVIQKPFIEDKRFNLLNPFSNEGFLRASKDNPSEILFPYKIYLLSHFSAQAAAEVANFAARLGLESPHLSYPLAFPLSTIPKPQGPLIFIGDKDDLKKIGIKRESIHLLPNGLSGIYEIPSKNDMPDILICGEKKGIETILRYLSTLPTDSKGGRDPIFLETRRLVEALNRLFIIPSSPSSKPKRVLRSYGIDNGRKEIFKTLRGIPKPISTHADPVEVEIFITEPEKERHNLSKAIRNLLEKRGFLTPKLKVKVLNAYKPGLNWMREVVLKEILKKKVDRIEIAFRPFVEKGLEESLRWLQEVYPIDEVFAKKLKISKDKITFKKDSRIHQIYRVCAWRGDKKVYEAQFSPKWKTLDYLIPFPRLGKVHPSTGWLSVKVGGKEILGHEIRTALEHIWEIYQKRILPLIAKEMGRVISRKRVLPPSPIFEELRFDIFHHYPMEPLDVGEERISPLEALHEELYFVTLDFFSNYLKNKNLSNLSIGRILPVIHPHHPKRKGQFNFTLSHCNRDIFLRDGSFQILLKGLAFRDSDVLIHLWIETEKKEDLKPLKASLLSLKPSVPGYWKIEKVIEEGKPRRGLRIIAIASEFGKKKPISHRRKRKPLDIPMDRPIGYQESLTLLHSFKGLPGVHIIYEGTSSGGLPIYSIEHTYPCLSPFVSHWKQAVWKPTFFINCRHHANEVSSTNAGFKLSHLLTTRPDYQRLLKKINVIINPMENVDGVVTLEEMLRLTPCDKLHAGRYNRAGREYYSEYFNPKTPFGEAKVKANLWRRWLPDVCVDNHGFPSHEWEQPFSGYAPYRFREWWIPRAFFFFYLPFLEEKKGSQKRKRSERVGQWICNILRKEKDLNRWNQFFLSRYWKYRKQWMAPPHQQEEWTGWLPLQKPFRETNFSYRFPHITFLDFITEVADEIAYGKMLRNCISAHLKTNLSVITLLNSLHFLVKKKWHVDPKGGFQLLWIREKRFIFRSKIEKGGGNL